MDVLYAYKGKKYTLTQLAAMAVPGLNERKLRRRLMDHWSVADAISIPPGELRVKLVRSKEKSGVVDDIHLYIAACFVDKFLLGVWHPDDLPITRLPDGQYELKRRFYTWRFLFSSAMTFKAAAYFRPTGTLSYPIYECAFGGGHVRIVSYVDERGRSIPYDLPKTDCEGATTRMPEGYKHSMALRTS